MTNYSKFLITTATDYSLFPKDTPILDIQKVLYLKKFPRE